MFLWWCFGGGVFVVVFLWWCFCGGVFVVVWWCFCGVPWGGVFVVVFLWLCLCGVVVFFVVVWWCFCVGVMVFLCWCVGACDGAYFKIKKSWRGVGGEGAAPPPQCTHCKECIAGVDLVVVVAVVVAVVVVVVVVVVVEYTSTTTRPEDQGTRGQEDRGTRGPEDQRTRGPEDQGTRGPKKQKCKKKKNFPTIYLPNSKIPPCTRQACDNHAIGSHYRPCKNWQISGSMKCNFNLQFSSNAWQGTVASQAHKTGF